MALSPLINVQVVRQDTTIEVVPKGTGDQAQDEVFVTTTLTLAADIDPSKDVIVILPMATDTQQRPLLRWTEDDISTDAVTFDAVERSAYDQAVADALQDLQEGEKKKQQKLAKAIADAAQGFSQAVLKIKPGQRQLRFFYTLAAPAKGNRQYGFQILGPLASFALQAGGGIGVVALLPHNTTLIDAVALQTPGDPNSVLPRTDADLGGRRAVGWTWQYDPQFTVTYQYA